MTVPFPAPALERAAEADLPLILALPKGRILAECGPLLARAGIRPAADYVDEDSRRLRFPTDDPLLDVVRVRPFDVATFVAFGAAQIGICGADVLMEFDYPEIYAPLDLGIGACRISVAEPAETAGSDDPSRWSRVRVATKYPNHRPPPLRRARHPGRGGAPERRDGTGAAARPGAADRRPGGDRLDAEGQRLVETEVIAHVTSRLIVNRTALKTAARTRSAPGSPGSAPHRRRGEVASPTADPDFEAAFAALLAQARETTEQVGPRRRRHHRRRARARRCGAAATTPRDSTGWRYRRRPAHRRRRDRRAPTPPSARELRDALDLAARRIEAFHRAQIPADMRNHRRRGADARACAGRPLDAVGIYVPGGKAAYPSRC